MYKHIFTYDCNELLVRCESSPKESNYAFISALTTWPPVLVKIRHVNKSDTITTVIGLFCGSDLNSWTDLFDNVLTIGGGTMQRSISWSSPVAKCLYKEE